jgi:signal transduction histidine kinase
MFSKNLPNPAKSIKLKLTLLYSGLFILSSLLLFVAIFAYIASTLTQHDRDLVMVELRELTDTYLKNDIRTIEERLELKRKFHRRHPFLVRIADTSNQTLGLYLPSPWTEFNVKNLDKIDPKPQPQWINLPAIGGRHYLEVASARLQNGYWIQVGMSSEDREIILSRLRSTFGVVIGPMVLFGFICGWILTYYVLRPIQNLVAAVKSVRSGHMDARVPVSGTGDELDELAIHFNRMLQKVATLLKAMKDCLDNVAHDLRTPVTHLRNLAESALQEPRNLSNQHHALSACAEETERINTMLNTLLNISEAESGIMRLYYEEIEIKRLVENMVDAYRLIADKKSIPIRIDGDHLLTAMIDPNRMSQVIANLLDNAIKYTPEGGEVHIVFFREDGHIIIRVQDSGFGISPEELALIWDRLYRGNQSRDQSGLGLGLSQAKAIIGAHSGKIKVSSEPGKGSIFTIRIPASV